MPSPIRSRLPSKVQDAICEAFAHDVPIKTIVAILWEHHGIKRSKKQLYEYKRQYNSNKIASVSQLDDSKESYTKDWF